MKASRLEIDLLTHDICIKYKIPFKFMSALIQTESSYNQFAMRYEPGYLWTYSVKEIAELLKCSKSTVEMMEKTSWGLTQIMGANLYASLNFRGWPGELLCNPELALDLTAQFIVDMMRRQELFWSNPLDVYAAYNCGSVRYTMEKTYVNSRNVNNFNKHYKAICEKINEGAGAKEG